MSALAGKVDADIDAKMIMYLLVSAPYGSLQAAVGHLKTLVGRSGSRRCDVVYFSYKAIF